MNADDIDQLMQDIFMQPPLVVPVRTEQEAVEVEDLPPLDAANAFSQGEHILQEQASKHGTIDGIMPHIVVHIISMISFA